MTGQGKQTGERAKWGGRKVREKKEDERRRRQEVTREAERRSRCKGGMRV